VGSRTVAGVEPKPPPLPSAPQDDSLATIATCMISSHVAAVVTNVHHDRALISTHGHHLPSDPGPRHRTRQPHAALPPLSSTITCFQSRPSPLSPATLSTNGYREHQSCGTLHPPYPPCTSPDVHNLPARQVCARSHLSTLSPPAAVVSNADEEQVVRTTNGLHK